MFDDIRNVEMSLGEGGGGGVVMRSRGGRNMKEKCRAQDNMFQ